jgi:predicted nucleic acid-binding Zn ribbon protein
VSAANFKLKGSGWYETDFKNKPKETKNNNNNLKETSKKTEKQNV